MTVNYQIAVRKSFLSKIGIYLQQNGSRDMSIPLSFNDGIVDYVFDSTTYGVVPLEPGQELFSPGINLLFLSEEDIASGRSHSTKKRYLLPVKIIVQKDIQGNTRPQVVKNEVLKVCKTLLQCLSDGYVQIWDYEIPGSPVFTGSRGTYHDSAYSFVDESLAFSGGDIRMSALIFINYMDTTL